MKTITILAALLVSLGAIAEDKPAEFYTTKVTEIEKKDALKALLDKQPIYRCQQVELSKKLTIVKKKRAE